MDNTVVIAVDKNISLILALRQSKWYTSVICDII